jgi:hypothetical protein
MFFWKGSSLITAAEEIGRGRKRILLGGSGVNQLHLAAQAGFKPSALVFVDRAFFYRLIYQGNCMRKELLGCFPVFLLDGLSQFFDLSAKSRFVFSGDGVSPKAAAVLANG